MGTPESKAKWHNVAKDTDYNFAPDLDEDMVHTQKHLFDTQTRLGHQWVIEDVQLPDEEPVALFVQTAATSDPICSSAGCTQYAHKKTPRGYDIDYFVPNFGADPEVATVMDSIALGEKAHAHKLVMGTPESRAKWHNVAKDTLYDYDPELDEDMKYTATHLGDTEDRLGHKWVIEDVQLPEGSVVQINSDNQDACSSEKCFHSNWYQKQLDKIVQYPTPTLDEDVVKTLDHEA